MTYLVVKEAYDGNDWIETPDGIVGCAASAADRGAGSRLRAGRAGRRTGSGNRPGRTALCCAGGGD